MMKTMFNGKKKFIWVVLLIVVIGGYFYSKGKNGFVVVETTEVEFVKPKKTVSASGSVISKNEANVAFAASGRLEGLNVAEGDFIEAGKYLGWISNYDSTQTSQAYKDARDVAQRDLDLYIENYSTNLSAVGGTDEYNINIRRLNELASKAEASYQSTLGTLAKTYLYSLFDGTVIDIYVEPGEVITLGTAVAKIADLDNLIFEVQVDQEDFGLLQIDQKVEITLDSYDGQIFEGVVSALPRYADEETEEFVIEIALVQAEEFPVLLGMNGDASIIIEETSEEVNALTFDVFYSDSEGTYVWIDSNGKLEKLHLEIGLEGDIYNFVLTDLTDRTIVIPIENGDTVEGSKVKYEK